MSRGRADNFISLCKRSFAFDYGMTLEMKAFGVDGLEASKMQLELTFISKEKVGSGVTSIQGLVRPACAN